MRDLSEPLISGESRGQCLESGELVQGGTWGADLKDIVQLAGPAILQLSFQQAVIVTNQSMAGHLGPQELAAAAIAVTWFNLMWFFIIGASSALDTLASQAFGAGDRPGVISWAVSSFVILSLMAIPMAVALYFGDFVAKYFFQQPDEICKLVGIYCYGILPGLWPFIWSLIIMKGMQAQNMMWGPAFVTIGMFVANIFVNLGLIKLYGFTGAAYAQSVSRVALLLFLIAWVLTVGKGCITFDQPALYTPRSRGSLDFSTMQRTELAETGDEEFDIGDTHLAPPPVRIHDSAGSSPPGKRITKEEPLPFAQSTLKEVVVEGLSKDRLLLFLQLGTAGGLMMAADASSFDITTAMAGFLGVEQVCTYAIPTTTTTTTATTTVIVERISANMAVWKIANIDANQNMMSFSECRLANQVPLMFVESRLTVIEFIFTSFPYGIATAATIRVGNMLGAGDAKSARQSAYLCLAGCACFNLIIMVAFFAFGGYVGYIFTDDPTVVKIVAKLSILAGLYQVPDCVYGCVSGILRGTGRQASLMWSNLLGFWVLGMPVCALLAFVAKLGVVGLWIGLVTGLSCSALFVLIMMLRLDWEEEAKIAVAAQLAAKATEEEVTDDAGGDIFLSEPLSSPHSQPHTPQHHMGSDMARGEASRVLAIRRPISQPVSFVGSQPQRYGSLGGSYARSRNSHL